MQTLVVLVHSSQWLVDFFIFLHHKTTEMRWAVAAVLLEGIDLA